MRYLAVLGVGLVAAVLTAMLWIVVAFMLPIAMPFLLSRVGLDRSGVGSASAVISSGSILLAAMIGFLCGAAWMLLKR